MKALLLCGQGNILDGFVLAVFLLPGAARAQTSAPNKSTPSGLRAQAKVDDKQAVLDRRELVLPAANNFHPESAAQKVRLRLVVEKNKLQASEHVRYRLEIINAGSKPYVFNELSPGFFKSGRLPNDRIRLVIKEPNGSEIDLKSPLKSGDDIGGKEHEFPPNWSETQKTDWVKTTKMQARAAGYLFVELGPGETLRTRGDAPGDAFRSLLTRYKFREPGTYELRAVLDGLLKVGAQSNPVRITISRTKSGRARL